LELLGESNIVQAHRLTDLLQEADELMAILVTSVKTEKNGEVRSENRIWIEEREWGERG
jgi:hypothetical protein